MIKRFIKYYKPYRLLFAMDVVSAILIAGLDLVIPRFTNHLISNIIPLKIMQPLLYWGMLLVLFFIVRLILHYYVEYYGHVVGVGMEHDMRKDMFAHIQQLPISYFDNVKVGKLMSRLVNDLNDIAELAHHGPEDFLISLVLLVGSFYLMFTSNVYLAIVMTILVPLMLYVGVKQNLKFRSAFRTMRERLSEINAQAEDNFSGIRVVKAYNAELKEQEQFAKGNSHFASSRKYALKIMAEFGVTVKGFVLMITFTVLIFGGYLVIQDMMTIGQLVEFILYVQLFQQPINRISALIMMYNQAMAGFERFIAIMDLKPQSDFPEAIAIDQIKGDIAFNDVTFEYGDRSEKHVLNHISFKVKAGSKVAFVGPSGSGKSTLCNLIPRFYEITQGSITIDEVDIRNIQIKSLRHHVGIVQQEVFIFAGSVGENILYGKADATEEEAIIAAKCAEAWDFIKDLPDGLNTTIGERGVKLSGGQRQRLSLARMFLKNPKILLLDEATSSLDNTTERQIQITLDELAKGRTTLVVAHRLSTIKDADWIYVLTDKGIMEEGTHDDLLNKHGLYHRLVNSEKEI
ncbi:MAG: ATP-binding cassette subfamily B bacterial [Erysipelotrichaceae bacterium]|nr:MAG: ATP-binding cassette subfamily B [Erysipelotrichaceae bacterium]TXT17841.1 MAG: ATP-binding cassette subfamily B bacterial [Erysipelotrichaceae bacterium]